MNATVYLVGAGPGDAGLLTVRGSELLKRADAVIYDYLANPGLLALAPKGAKRVYVGKKGFDEHITQGELNDLLIHTVRAVEARGGTTVVRLKGGDPYVFGRGGEEALALAEAGIPFEVVPGVTSGVAAAAYAGIPVTHRGIASSVTFVTGHEDLAKDGSAIDWPALAQLARRGGTLCFYMGMRSLPRIASSLMRAGCEADMPVVIVQHGTTAAQRTLVSTLGAAPEDAGRNELGAPSIILVGRVAQLRERLAWFERKPLFGKRIAVTRSRSQAGALSARLAELGADAFEFPTIETVPPDDLAPLDDAIASASSYDWIVFTSANGVDAFFDRLPGDARSLNGCLVAAIGPATARRLRARGIVADAVPAEYRGEAVFDAIADASAAQGRAMDGFRVLMARAETAREALPGLLRAAGVHVDVVAAYKTVPPSDANAGSLRERLAQGGVDAITFTSSSTARNLASLLGDAPSALEGVDFCSIGPITSDALREQGLGPAVEASEHTVDGLVAAICEHYGKGAS